MVTPGPAPAAIRLTTTPQDLARLHPWFAAAAAAHGLPNRLTHGMAVALEEAVMNVAMHAFPPETDGEVAVSLAIDATQAVLTVEDNGPPFDPVAAPVTNPRDCLTDPTPGGLGLTLLRHYCPDPSYRRDGGRNRLTLRFPVPAG